MAAGRTRDAILDAARGALASEGSRGASMRRIAAEAGVTHAAIYKHFEDKDTLLAAIAEREFAVLVERISDSVPATAPPEHRLPVLLGEFVRAGLDNPNLYEFLFWTLPAEHVAVARTNDVFLLLRSAVAAYLRAGSSGTGASVPNGGDADEDVEHLAGFLLTAAIGYVARRFVRPLTVRERVDDYVAFLVGGLR